MTSKEAIDNLKYLISDESTDTQFDYIEEIKIAIKAMEEIDKFIPKRPLHSILNDNVRSCPTCGVYISFDALNQSIKEAPEYCSACGQKFLWE